VTRPRILFLSYGFPRPGSGIGVRTLTFLRALSRFGDVTFVYRAPEDLTADELAPLKDLCRECIPIPVASFGWARPLYHLLDSNKKYLKLLPLLFSKRPIYIHSNILARNRSKILLAYLDSVNWSDFDLVHAGRLFISDAIMDYLPAMKRSGVKTLLDLDDVESEAVKRALSLSSDDLPRTWIGKSLGRLDLMRLRHYEKKAIPLFDVCVVCSELDQDKVNRTGLSKNAQVIPNSVDSVYFKPGPAGSGSSLDILFPGNMSFSPNVDAVRFFAQEVFPDISRKVPTSRFVIAGKKPVQSVLSLANGTGIIVTGELPDLRPVYDQSAVVVIPIRYGGGTRIKILEAMAMGKAVVSTAIGAEGIPVTDGREIIIADHADDLADQCIRLLKDPVLRESIGQRSREFVVRHFDRDLIETQIQNMYRTLLGEG
jgi:polysaccharide biosynthesis protein PslH